MWPPSPYATQYARLQWQSVGFKLKLTDQDSDHQFDMGHSRHRADQVLCHHVTILESWIFVMHMSEPQVHNLLVRSALHVSCRKRVVRILYLV